MNKIALLIRRSREYYLNHKIDFPHKLKSTSLKNWAYTKHNIDSWNIHFDMSYIEFRRELSRISFSSYSRNCFDRIYYWSDCDHLIQEKNLIVVPIDEDDWLSNSLVDNIRTLNLEACSAISWKIIHIRNDCKVTSLDGIRSCSYALKMPYPPDCLLFNWKFSKQMQDGEVQRINKILAVKVLNISSLARLRQSKQDYISMVENRFLVRDSDIFGDDFSPMVKQYNKLLTSLYDSYKG